MNGPVFTTRMHTPMGCGLREGRRRVQSCTQTTRCQDAIIVDLFRDHASLSVVVRCLHAQVQAQAPRARRVRGAGRRLAASVCCVRLARLAGVWALHFHCIRWSGMVARSRLPAAGTLPPASLPQPEWSCIFKSAHNSFSKHAM